MTINPLNGTTAPAPAVMQKSVAPPAPAVSSEKPDKVSISAAGHAAAGDADGDGDSR